MRGGEGVFIMDLSDKLVTTSAEKESQDFPFFLHSFAPLWTESTILHSSVSFCYINMVHFAKIQFIIILLGKIQSGKIQFGKMHPQKHLTLHTYHNAASSFNVRT